MSVLFMAGVTDPGKQRENNEDAFVTVPEIGLAVLADGMGGHQAGEVASGIAVDIVRRHLLARFADLPKRFDDPEGRSWEAVSVREAVELANRAIYEAAQRRPECAGMGSTVVAAVFNGGTICIAHVGDSRLYRYREQRLEQITEDHSMIQELLRRGFITPEEARVSTNRNVVTRALGVEPDVQVDVSEQMFRADDVYLLCSDGLSDVLADEEIEAILRDHGEDIEAALNDMVGQVNAQGGPDNVSVVLVRTGNRFSRNKKAVKQLLDANR